MGALNAAELSQPVGRAPRAAEPYFFLINRSSGDGTGDDTAEMIRARFGADTRMHVMSEGDDLTRIVGEAVENGAGTIVAVGGDGTVCGVAAAIRDTDCTLGVLPGGTFNFFARSLDIPQEMEPALEVIASGTPVPMNLGEVNDRVFINNASLGAYAMILDEREAVYKRWGRSRMAAYWSVIAAMATLYRPLTMRITVDGEVVRAKSPMAFIGISAHQLDEYEIEGGDEIRAGRFAVLLAPDSGRFMLIWRALKIAMRGVRRGRDFTLLSGEEVLIETRRSHRLVARDGEKEKMEGPYHFRVLKDAVRVIRPS